MGIFSRIFGSSKEKTKEVPRVSYDELIATLKVNSDKIIEVNLLKEKFKETRERYEVVAKEVGVPADVIFALHYRESSLNFKACLHNGERIIGTGLLTRLVPKGRGPFNSWEESAIDALEIERYKFPKEWTLASKLAFTESFNGLGYKKRNVPSPYVLSWTNGYSSGKYIADGKYSSIAIDKQCGTAAIILGINLA